MKILLLSAYDASSHRYWREGLVSALPEFEWTVLSLPPRYFNWRIRGNALSWTQENSQQLAQSFDLILATSMTDLATLKALNPLLVNVPSILYFHENQFFYPNNTQQAQRIEPQWVNIYSALSANLLLFNSEFNKQTFNAGVRSLLKKMPDHINANDVLESFESKSQKIVVPLSQSSIEFAVNSEKVISHDKKPINLVWNHRWEHDKGPGRLLAIVECLLSESIDFSISIIGQQFRQQPPEFEKIKALLHKQKPKALKHFGFVESEQVYREALSSADVVLSTALHDFQGIAVLEAVALGCIPLLPDRVVYPEIFPKECLYSGDENISVEAQFAVSILKQIINQRDIYEKLQSSLQSQIQNAYSWQANKAHYIKAFNTAIKNHSRSKANSL